jgi:hypothetical protein
MPLRLWVTLGLATLCTVLVADLFVLHPQRANEFPLEALCFMVLSFPLGTAVFCLSPQYEAGAVMVAVALAANCYLWGYGIECVVRAVRRSNSDDSDKNQDSN